MLFTPDWLCAGCASVHGRPPLVSAPGWREQVLPSAFAALASCTVAAAIVTGGLLVFHPGSGARLAALRTLVLCLVALALGWSGFALPSD